MGENIKIEGKIHNPSPPMAAIYRSLWYIGTYGWCILMISCEALLKLSIHKP